jgi:hypothetical protein
MDIQERFGLFDAYVKSIDGLSESVKENIPQIARYSFEAETGIDVTSNLNQSTIATNN